VTSAPMLSIVGAAFVTLAMIFSARKPEPGTRRRTQTAIILAVIVVLVLTRLLLPHASCIAIDYPRLAAMSR
jgi:hypothetical protein